MTHSNRKSLLLRIVAVGLCVSVAFFFSAILIHTHGIGTTSDHTGHCQVCALGHTTASTTIVISLIVSIQMLMMMRRRAPSRGSLRIVTLPTTRPPPASL